MKESDKFLHEVGEGTVSMVAAMNMINANISMRVISTYAIHQD